MVAMTVNVDISFRDRVDAVAKRCHKSRAQILREALVARMEYEAWVDSALDEADRAIAAGDTVPHDDAVKTFEAMFH